MAAYQLGLHAPKLADPARCFIAPSADIIGQIHVGLDCSIWFGAVLRADNEPIYLGDKTNVQENAVLHTDPGFPLHIGACVTIGHKAMLHGCTIGEASLIGIGAIVLNGAKIGKNCLIGAGALIGEGKEIPDNSLVIGMPGKVVRSLSEAEIMGLKASAEHYAQKSQFYRENLKEV